MVKMKKVLLKSFNWILFFLISMLGFSILSCDPEPPGNAYRSPHADYAVKSAVVDTVDTELDE